MYVIALYLGGMTSQMLHVLEAITIAELTGLRYVHTPSSLDHYSEVYQWQKLFQWEKYQDNQTRLPPPPLHFVCHFFSDSWGSNYRNPNIMSDLDYHTQARFNVSLKQCTHTVRLHKNKLNLSWFDKRENTVHLLVENMAPIDVTNAQSRTIVRQQFAKMKSLLQHNLNKHHADTDTNERQLSIAVHLRTGDLLEHVRDGRMTDLLNVRKTCHFALIKFAYWLSYIQIVFLTKRITDLLKKRNVSYQISLYALKEDPLLHRLLHKMSYVEDNIQLCIGGTGVDTLRHLAQSDIVLAQRGGFARFAGALGESLVLFTANRPSFLPGPPPLLSTRSPLFNKGKQWALSTPLDLFRLRTRILALLNEKGLS